MNFKHRRMLALLPLICVALVAGGPALSADSGTEVERLIKLMDLAPGMNVAEVGAGNGKMTVELAKLLGAGSQVYSTEVDEKNLEKISELVAEAGLTNVEVIAGEAADTKLVEGCCDGVFMRTVYHHFTEPEAMVASLFAAMRPGGRLAVIDFFPRKSMSGVDGVSESRGGHGMPISLLEKELTAAGFVVEQTIESWEGRQYCVLASKPAAGGS